MVTISDAAVLPLDSTLENIMSDKKKTSGAFALAQRLGRSLMLPIATLPAAGLLGRLGAGGEIQLTDALRRLTETGAGRGSAARGGALRYGMAPGQSSRSPGGFPI